MNKILIGIALLSILVLSGCQEKVCPECEECPTCEVCEECPEEKALMDVDLMGWMVNTQTVPSGYQMFYDVNIINYGYVEAKDVTVECLLYDENGKILSRISKNVGTIASTSYNYKKILAVTPTEVKTADEETYFSEGCYIKKCRDCEILYKRIPGYEKLLP